MLIRHALRNALLPMITVAGLQLPTLLGGALVTETVFTWPGMGRLFLDSIGYRDYPVVMGLLMISAVHGADRQPDRRHAVRGRRPADQGAMSATLSAPAPARRIRSPALRRLLRHRLAMFGLAARRSC